MPYQSDIQVCDGLIRIAVSGERVPGHVARDSTEVMEKTMDAIASSGITDCLLMLNLTGPLSPMDAFDVVSVSEEVGWKRHFRVAIVDCNASSSADVQFTELVASNRAFPVRVFESEGEAMEWLRQ
jgi:hypothetical protein